MDEEFVVRQVCEKHLAIGKEVFWAFMYLEKAYGAIYWHGIRKRCRVYGVGRKLLKPVQSF